MAERARAGMSNGIDPKKLQARLKNIEEINAKVASKTGEHMAWCKKQRAIITEEIGAAADEGTPKVVLKGLIELRKKLASAQDIRENLEPDMKDLFDQACVAVGTELPEAAEA
jgi:glutamyl-tRNA reductase